MSNEKIPAISVIIPMYNAEKYIGECLDSIFNQTFKDFEIIVVDDCSTDNSCAVVEKYLNNGGGQLKLIRSKVNSGGASVPRNTGIGLSRGEYIMFIDSDDAIVKDSLGELYEIAKKFYADIVYSEKFYQMFANVPFSNTENLQVKSNIKEIPVDRPVLMTEDLTQRVIAYGNSKITTTVWNILFRRDFLVENRIEFPRDIMHGEDEIFMFCALCLAKNFVTVPNIFYVYRIHQSSSIHSALTVEGYFKTWYSSVFKAIGVFDRFMSKFELFNSNPEYKYLIFENYVIKNIPAITQIYSKIPASKLDNLIRAELEKVDDLKPLAAFLFSRMSVFNAKLASQQNLIRAQQQQIQRL